MSRHNRSCALAIVLIGCMVVGLTNDAIAQASSSSDRIAFDRPEAWAILRYAGAELQAARRSGRLVPHAAAGANVVDNVFQTDAQTFTIVAQ
jgi:hypothetical protein